MKTPWVLRHSLKNRYLMMLRNDRPTDVVRDLPAILGTEMARAVDYALSHPSALLGYVDLLRLAPEAIAARREIQARRLRGPSVLRAWLRPFPYLTQARVRSRVP
jgi:hypothetical protein